MSTSQPPDMAEGRAPGPTNERWQSSTNNPSYPTTVGYDPLKTRTETDDEQQGNEASERGTAKLSEQGQGGIQGNRNVSFPNEQRGSTRAEQGQQSGEVDQGWANIAASQAAASHRDETQGRPANRPPEL